jgi:hypothetical protein
VVLAETATGTSTPIAHEPDANLAMAMAGLIRTAFGTYPATNAHGTYKAWSDLSSEEVDVYLRQLESKGADSKYAADLRSEALKRTGR